MKIRIDRQWRWLVALGGILVPGIVFGAFSVPHQFEAGTPIKASEMNANFEAIAARLDEQAEPLSPPVIGTLSLDGVASALPITKFSQSIELPFVNGVPGKLSFSEIVVQGVAGAATPDLNLALAAQTPIAEASVVLGDLTIDVENVRVTGVSIVESSASLPQQVVALTFRVVSWTWDDGDGPATVVTYNLGTGVGGGPIDQFAFGYFPPSLTPDASYTAIASYQQQLGCPTPAAGCKVAYGPLLLNKRVGADTLSDVNAVLTAAPTTVTVDWFADDASLNNSVGLEQSVATRWSLTTGAGGTLQESVAFTYSKIIWHAGIKETRWDVGQNQPF
jgi:hypothetical protein